MDNNSLRLFVPWGSSSSVEIINDKKTNVAVIIITRFVNDEIVEFEKNDCYSKTRPHNIIILLFIINEIEY